MKCRKNVRKLIQEYNAAPPADKPNTALTRFRDAVVALKARAKPAARSAHPGEPLRRLRVRPPAVDGRPPEQRSWAALRAQGPVCSSRGTASSCGSSSWTCARVSATPTICLPYWDF